MITNLFMNYFINNNYNLFYSRDYVTKLWYRIILLFAALYKSPDILDTFITSEIILFTEMGSH